MRLHRDASASRNDGAGPLPVGARHVVQVAGQRLVDQGQLGGVGFVEVAALDQLGGGALGGLVGAEQGTAGQGRGQRTAHAVVDHRVLAGAVGGDGGAGHGIGGAAVGGQDEHLLALHLHRPVGQGLDQGHGTRVGFGHQPVERLDPLVALAGGQRQGVGGRQGLGAAGCHQQRQGQQAPGPPGQVKESGRDGHRHTLTSSRARSSCPCSRQ